MLRTIDEIEHISEDYQVKFYDYEKTFYGSTSNPDESDDNVIIYDDGSVSGWTKEK